MISFKVCLFVLSFCLSYVGFNSMILATDEEEESKSHRVKKNHMELDDAYNGSFAGLPNEILIHHIVTFLYPSEISALQQTCKGLYATMKDSNPVWKRLYICLKAKGPLDFEDAARDWKILYQTTSRLQRRLRGLSLRVEAAMLNIETAFHDNHPFIEYMRGIIGELQVEKGNGDGPEQAEEVLSMAFQHYRKACNGGYKPAQKRLISAIYAGDLGIESIRIEERRSMLEQMALKGHRYAQKLIDNAHFVKSPLGYHIEPMADYFETLRKRAQKNGLGAQRAKKWLAQAIAYGKFYYTSMADEKRFQCLLELEAQGDKEARYCVNRTLYNGTLGQEQRDEKERFDTLEQRAVNGDEDARSWVYRAIYRGTLSQNEVDEEERFAKLFEEANKGNILAQQYVNHANYYGDLRRNDISEVERFNTLVQREQQGDQDAANYITNAFYYGKLKRDEMQDEERLRTLLCRAVEGDRQAQINIWSVINEGELGQEKDDEKALIMAYGFLLLNALTGNRG